MFDGLSVDLIFRIHVISGLCLVAVLLQTIYLFRSHFAAWRVPFLQKLYLRISLLPLVFSICAFISLFRPNEFILLDAVRHVYEGYSLYSFASLMILHCGGDSAVEDKFTIVRDDPSPRIVYGNPFRFYCCELVHIGDSRSTLRLHKAGVMQYMIVGPALQVAYYVVGSTISAAPHWVGLVLSGLRIASILTTMRCMFGMYWLLKDSLHDLGAVTKFTVIKVVVFLAVVQGIIVGQLLRYGVLSVPGHIMTEYEGQDLSTETINEQFLSRVLMLEMTVVAWFGFLAAFRADDVPQLDLADIEDVREAPSCMHLICPEAEWHGHPTDSTLTQTMQVCSFGDILLNRLEVPDMLLHGHAGEKTALVGSTGTARVEAAEGSEDKLLELPPWEGDIRQVEKDGSGHRVCMKRMC